MFISVLILTIKINNSLGTGVHIPTWQPKYLFNLNVFTSARGVFEVLQFVIYEKNDGFTWVAIPDVEPELPLHLV
jgi:hypothetical protein